MTASSLPAALRAGAEGLYALEAATGLIIAHGTWLARDDFRSFIHHGAGTAAIDWEAAIDALHAGRLPCSGGFSELCKPSCKVGMSHQVTVAIRVLKARRG